MCACTTQIFDLALIHHVDDGRIGGPTSGITECVKYLCEYILLEVSSPITAGDSVDFLKRTKVRTELGWVTLPNHTLRLRILEGLGYTGEKTKTLKPAATPGVRRNMTDEDMRKDWRPDTLFRSIGGCGTYLSSDVPNILPASKEIARKFHDPRVSDRHVLARLGRYLSDKGDWGYVNEVIKIGKAKTRLEVYEDASFCGDENSRSSTGITIEATGFQLMRVSQTQPGLPALSSGESELRSLSRSCCCPLYTKQLMHDVGYDCDIVLMADATAALGAAANLNGSRMRHMNLAETFVKKCIRDKIVKTQKIGTKDQKGDLYTKHVDVETMKRLSTRYRDCSDVLLKKGTVLQAEHHCRPEACD